ncbi:MAG: hypothetical protein IH878_10810 [Gemmatimonadetes bacterium]|nr:hypothetical protein [Gemmatimonadota bacterium]
MVYRVTARVRTDTGADFLRKLTDGTIESQSPDGREIVDAMNRAVLSDDGNVSWSEVCYCRTPLAHERATVFDKHFEALETEVIEGYQNYDGRSFMEYLAEIVEAK